VQKFWGISNNTNKHLDCEFKFCATVAKITKTHAHVATKKCDRSACSCRYVLLVWVRSRRCYLRYSYHSIFIVH